MTDTHVCASSVGFPLNTGGSLGRHCTFMVSVVGNPERKIGYNGGFLAVGFLDVAVFHASPKLGSGVLVSGNWGNLSGTSGSLQLTRGPVSIGRVTDGLVGLCPVSDPISEMFCGWELGITHPCKPVRC